MAQNAQIADIRAQLKVAEASLQRDDAYDALIVVDSDDAVEAIKLADQFLSSMPTGVDDEREPEVRELRIEAVAEQERQDIFAAIKTSG